MSRHIHAGLTRAHNKRMSRAGPPSSLEPYAPRAWEFLGSAWCGGGRGRAVRCEEGGTYVDGTGSELIPIMMAGTAAKRMGLCVEKQGMALPVFLVGASGCVRREVVAAAFQGHDAAAETRGASDAQPAELEKLAREGDELNSQLKASQDSHPQLPHPCSPRSLTRLLSHTHTCVYCPQALVPSPFVSRALGPFERLPAAPAPARL